MATKSRTVKFRGTNGKTRKVTFRQKKGKYDGKSDAEMVKGMNRNNCHEKIIAGALRKRNGDCMSMDQAVKQVRSILKSKRKVTFSKPQKRRR